MSSVPSEHKEPATPQEECNDPVWKLLENASKKEPSAFFARNVTREARLQASAKSSFYQRFKALFTTRQIGPALFLSLIVITGFLLWPANNSTQSSDTAAQQIDTALITATITSLNELIIEESLNAAADDPSIYTRDEIVAMIGF